MKSRFKLFTIVCFLALTIFSAQMLQAQVFSIPVRISPFYSHWGGPQIAVDSQGNINVVWQDRDHGNIYFSRSIDGGQTFSAPLKLSFLTGPYQSNMRPKIIVDNEDGIYVFWWSGNIGFWGVAYTFSSDGSNFSELQITSTEYWEDLIDVEADKQGNINLLLSQAEWSTPNDRRIVFRRLSNGGQILSPSAIVSNSTHWIPKIAVDDLGNINVTWMDRLVPDDPLSYEIMFSRSTDGGQTFSPPLNISNTAGQSVESDISLDPQGNINIIWTDQGSQVYPAPHYVFYSRSTNGVEFSDPINFGDLFSWLGSSQQGPRIKVDSEGNINIVWKRDRNTYFSRSTDEGQTFSIPQNISNLPFQKWSLNPLIDLDSQGNIGVSFETNRTGYHEIFFTRSTDGINFAEPVNVSHCNTVQEYYRRYLMTINSEGSIYFIWGRYNPKGIFFSSMQRLKADAGPDREVIVGETVLFDGTGSYALDHDIVDYLWDFGEGITAHGVQVEYVYAFPNDYTVSLTVTDDVGKVASDTAIITVITVAQAIQNLIDDVNRLVNEGKISPGKKDVGMIRKLNEALDAHERGNDRVACNKLHDFIDQVNAAILSDPLTPEEGQELIDAANTLINILCGQ